MMPVSMETAAMLPDMENEENTFQESSQLITKCLASDNETSDLCHKLSVNSAYVGVCSGMQDKDYPTGNRLPLVTDVKRIPLPAELIEQFAHMQCNCLIGLFPEIGRAWLTVDSDIFVWKYKHGDDLAYFDGLNETILSVALVQPKPGIFRDHVKYLLVLTTPLDIVILGVSFTADDVNNDMHLLPDPLFTLPTDSTYLMQTIGTSLGRIFTGGKDGCLYEIQYQANKSWFRNNCQKVNHSTSKLSFLIPSAVTQLWVSQDDSIAQIVCDETRNVLYTRSERGSIGVFDLGVDGSSTSRVKLLHLDAMKRKAKSIATGVEPSNFNEIVNISPVTLRESNYINLVAITQSGVRLYFVANSNLLASGGSAAAPSGMRPNGLYLVHVRLPPGFTNSSVQRPTSLHQAHYQSGSLLLASTSGDNATLWFVNGDMFAFDKTSLKENHASFPLDGRSWSMTSSAASSSSSSKSRDPPPHVTQHRSDGGGGCEYVIVTSQGCHVFNKLLPVDQLRHLLEHVTTTDDNELVNNFFNIYNEGEAICCCIILATTSKLATDKIVTERAISAFLQYGTIQHEATPSHHHHHHHQGQQHHHHGVAPLSPIQHNTTSIFNKTRPTGGGANLFQTPMAFSTPMPQHNPNPSYRNMLMQQHQPATNMVMNVAEGFHSERQHGLYKMFARIVRPVWQSTITQDYHVTEDGRKKTFAISKLDLDVITSVLDDLKNLKTFMTKYCLIPADFKESQARRGGHVTQMSQSIVNAHQQRISELSKAELELIYQLYGLLDHTIQVLGLWRLIQHHRVHIIVGNLEESVRNSLKTITFSQLIIGGKQISCLLVSCLVDQFMSDHATIGAISSQLRDICPLFYSPDDLICTQANELLSQARTSLPGKRKELLEEALQQLLKIARNVNLPVICQQLQAVQFFDGIVELCLKSAALRDPQNLALRFHETAAATANTSTSLDDNEVDQHFKNAHCLRLECYKCITIMLNDLLTASESHPQAPSIPTQPGPPKIQTNTHNSLQPLTPEMAQAAAESCLQAALKCEDELFHIHLYEWMIQGNLIEQITRVESPYIEKFLIGVCSFDDSNNVVAAGGSTATSSGITDLLWQWYERHDRHLKAAQVLIQLAEKVGGERDLMKRIELLSRAKVHAKTLTSVVDNQSINCGQLLMELEDKLQVAQIQLETLKQLQADQHQQDYMLLVSSLNSQLFDITTLYSEFADPYHLAEIKLKIIEAAGEHDEKLVENLWQIIIEKELAKCEERNGEISQVVKHKIISLSKNYSPSNRYFPLEYLICYLEQVNASHGGLHKTWVVDVFVQVGVPMYDLLAHYSQLHSRKLPVWASLGNPYHLVDVINSMLTSWLDDVTSLSANNSQRASGDVLMTSFSYKGGERHVVTRWLDLVAMSLVELTSQSRRDPNTNLLISSLEKNQTRLESLMTS